MKKAIVILAGIIVLPLAAKLVLAADNANVDVVMSIETIGVSATKVIDPVSVKPSTSTVIKGRVVFFNDSNTNVNFAVSIASTTTASSGGAPSTWVPATLGKPNPLTDNPSYRLRAFWAVFNATVTASDFSNDDDTIITSDRDSSGSVFWCQACSSTNVGTFATNGGTNVPVFGLGDNQRHLFFRFDAGPQTSGTAVAWVKVTAKSAP